jgi:hypothetical protein
MAEKIPPNVDTDYINETVHCWFRIFLSLFLFGFSWYCGRQHSDLQPIELTYLFFGLSAALLVRAYIGLTSRKKPESV